MESEERISPELFLSGSNWVYFSDYELIYNRYKEWCLIPAIDAKMTLYNPFECPSILEDFINVGRDIKTYLSDNKINCNNSLSSLFYSLNKDYKKGITDIILKFVKNYGLLLSIDPTNLPLSRRNQFFPRKEYPYEHFFYTDDGITYPDNHFTKDLHRHIAEPIPAFLACLDIIIDFVNKWDEFDKKKHKVTDIYKDGYSWGDIFEFFTVTDIGLRLGFEKSWVIKWRFSSLAQALKIMVIRDTASKKRKLKLCPYCGRAHSIIKAEYCSTKCAGTVRSNRARENLDKEIMFYISQGKNVDEIYEYFQKAVNGKGQEGRGKGYITKKRIVNLIKQNSKT